MLQCTELSDGQKEPSTHPLVTRGIGLARLRIYRSKELLSAALLWWRPCRQPLTTLKKQLGPQLRAQKLRRWYKAQNPAEPRLLQPACPSQHLPDFFPCLLPAECAVRPALLFGAATRDDKIYLSAEVEIQSPPCLPCWAGWWLIHQEKRLPVAELALVGPPVYLPRSPSVEKANGLSRNGGQGNWLPVSLVCPTHPHLPTLEEPSERLPWAGMSRTELISAVSGRMDCTMLGLLETGALSPTCGQWGRKQPYPISGKGPYLECSWEGLVPSAWVQVLLLLLGSEQLKVASVRENSRFNTNLALACVKRWEKDTGSSIQVWRVEPRVVEDTLGHVWETKSPGDWSSSTEATPKGSCWTGECWRVVTALHEAWGEADCCQDPEVPVVQYRLSASPGIDASGVGLSRCYFKYNFSSLWG